MIEFLIENSLLVFFLGYFILVVVAIVGMVLKSHSLKKEDTKEKLDNPTYWC